MKKKYICKFVNATQTFHILTLDDKFIASFSSMHNAILFIKLLNSEWFVYKDKNSNPINIVRPCKY